MLIFWIFYMVYVGRALYQNIKNERAKRSTILRHTCRDSRCMCVLKLFDKGSYRSEVGITVLGT